MTIKNHIIFNIFFIFLIKNINIINFSYLEWYLLFFSSIISCLLPDIDHPNSFIGRRISILSIFINKIFGHRKFTHSILFLFLVYKVSKFILEKKLLIFSKSIYYGITLGYLTHIIADMTTERGIFLLWPIKIKFRINIFNTIFIIILVLLILKNLQ